MFRKAFTMLELVFVIVILGIIASIGAEIISSLYDNYIKTRAINRLQAQSDLVLDQISKRLTYRIKASTIARKSTDNSYVSLPDADDDYSILEWIGKDNESFLGRWNGSSNIPGWSGFIDLDSNETDRNVTGVSRLKTLGSNLEFANATMKALSNDKVSLDGSTPNNPAIIFKGVDSYDIAQYGWDGVDGSYTYNVALDSNDTLDFTEAAPNEIFEQYDLVSSAYAIVPEGSANDFNLTLYYNYQPWNDMNYTGGDKTVLIENVSTFRFRQIGETIRIKLCIHDNNQTAVDLDFAFCKEKVVY